MRDRTLVATALLATAVIVAACRAPRPEPIPGVISACRASDYQVRGDGVERDGVGRFLIGSADCGVVRDSLGLAVIDRLLFTGVPQTSQSLPMLERPEDARRNAPPALIELRQRGWTQFLAQLAPTSGDDYSVRIDLAALRRWLERNNLSRKFGMP